jgi:hypothetical protein
MGARQLIREQLCSCPVAGASALILWRRKMKDLISFEIKMMFFNINLNKLKSND